MSKILNEKIHSLEYISDSTCKMTVQSAYIAQNAKPGQFVNVKCCDGYDALLRRPISICSVDRNKNTFDIVFQIKGKGTSLLSKRTESEEVNVIGPLGNSFEIDGQANKIAVVGGGIGVFPLLFLLQQYNIDCASTAYLGFRNKDMIVLKDEFERAAGQLFIATDDGSWGHKGLVVELLERDLLQDPPDIIYACGPHPMLRRVAEIAERYKVRCQISLEERMGCGIGACLVCACKTKRGDDWEYSHVCSDGPVFWSDKVIFDE